MNIALPALVTGLALGGVASAAPVRNWLLPVPDTTALAASEGPTTTDPTMHYGPRARVRIIRPDGVFDIRNETEKAPATEETTGHKGQDE